MLRSAIGEACLTTSLMLQAIPEFCPEQLILVELVSSIRVIPIDNLVQTVRSVVRQPPNIGPSVSHARLTLGQVRV